MKAVESIEMSVHIYQTTLSQSRKQQPSSDKIIKLCKVCSSAYWKQFCTGTANLLRNLTSSLICKTNKTIIMCDVL